MNKRSADLASGTELEQPDLSITVCGGVVNEVAWLSGCEAIWLCDPPGCGRQCDERLAWKRDVALEISVDVDRVPATVRLAGMLDGETAANLMALFAELIGEGFVDFELQTSALCVPDECGLSVLNGLQRLIRGSDGNFVWDGLTVNHPFPTKGIDPG
jgi:hypothetical protein